MGLIIAACQICDAKSERMVQRTCFQPGCYDKEGFTVNLCRYVNLAFTSASLLKDVTKPDWGFKLEALVCPMPIDTWEA